MIQDSKMASESIWEALKFFLGGGHASRSPYICTKHRKFFTCPYCVRPSAVSLPQKCICTLNLVRLQSMWVVLVTTELENWIKYQIHQERLPTLCRKKKATDYTVIEYNLHACALLYCKWWMWRNACGHLHGSKEPLDLPSNGTLGACLTDLAVDWML